MQDEATKALLKAERLFSRLGQDARLHILSWLNMRYGRPMTDTERQNKSRAERGLLSSHQRDTDRDELCDKDRDRNRDKPPLQPPGTYALTGFLEFWKQYPKRIGKGSAYKAWKDGKCEGISEVVVKAVREQNGYLTREGGRFVPNPATWLNQRRWEDEPPKPSGLGDKTAGNVEALRRAAIRLKGGAPDAAP